MEFYLLLSSTTGIVVVLTWILWRRTRSISFPLGIGFFYYWSLAGAWVVVYDWLGGDSSQVGFRYRSLYDTMFPVYLDEDYLLSILYFSLFLLVLLTTLLLFIRPAQPNLRQLVSPLKLKHYRVIVIGAVAAFLNFTIFRDQLAYADQTGISGYIGTRLGDVTPLFTVASLLIRIALVPTAIGLAVWFSGAKARYIVGDGNSRFDLLGYIAVLGSSFALAVVLGNKNELVFGTLSGILFYAINCPKPRTKFLAILGLFTFAAIGAIDTLRGLPVTGLASGINLDTAVTGFFVPFTSNEMFGASFSMYAAVHYQIPFTYGTSFVSLVASVVPHVFWEDRPATIYQHYADYIGKGTDAVGYSIHHVTGWYLNFGVPGIIAGAVVLGLLWAWCFNRFLGHPAQGHLQRIFTTLAPWTLVAYFPAFVRAGPEVYKGVILEAFVIPALIMALSCPASSARVLPESIQISATRAVSKDLTG